MMKVVTMALALLACFYSGSILANGASGGRALDNEIKCELPNGVVQSLPPTYCKMYGGKHV